MANTPYFPNRAIPPDLQRFPIRDYSESPGGISVGDSIRERIAQANEANASIVSLSKGLYGRAVTVGTTEVLLVDAQRLRSYLFVNGASATAPTLDSVIQETQNIATDATVQYTDEFDASNYRTATSFIVVSNVVATFTSLVLELQGYDVASETWLTTYTLATIVGAGSTVSEIASNKMTSTMRIKATLNGSGSVECDWSVGMTFKDGLAQSADAGLTGAVYIGPQGLTVESGYPLLESQERAFFMKENVNLYAIGKSAGQTVRVFEL